MSRMGHRGMAVLQSLSVAVAVLVIATAASRSRALWPGAAAVFAASTFLILVAAIGLFTRASLIDLAKDWRTTPALVVSCGVVLLLQVGDVARLGGIRTTVSLTVVYAAWVEEFVFRWILPRAFGDLLAPASRQLATVGAIVVSQSLFAAGHFLPGSVRSPWPDASVPLRLFAGGLLFWLVASRGGLTLAVLTHALLNLQVALPATALHARPTIAGVALVGAAALALLSAPTPPNRKPFTLRNHV